VRKRLELKMPNSFDGLKVTHLSKRKTLIDGKVRVVFNDIVRWVVRVDIGGYELRRQIICQAHWTSSV
jgi:hypothetical protein